VVDLTWERREVHPPKEEVSPPVQMKASLKWGAFLLEECQYSELIRRDPPKEEVSPPVHFGSAQCTASALLSAGNDRKLLFYREAFFMLDAFFIRERREVHPERSRRESLRLYKGKADF